MSRLADIIPGAVEVVGKRGPEPSADYVEELVSTIDNRLDDLIGIRPLRHLIFRPFSSIAPANVIRNVLGIPKPSELVEQLEDDIESRLRQLGQGRGLDLGSLRARLPF